MKIVLDKTAANLDPTRINENFRKIQEELNNKILYRNNPEGEPNEMMNDIDMNGNRIYNLPAPVEDHEAVRYKDFKTVEAGIAQAHRDAADAKKYAEDAKKYAKDAQEAELIVLAIVNNAGNRAYYNTYAEAVNDIVNIPDYLPVEIFHDETHDGHHTLYIKTGGVLSYRYDYDQLKTDLASDLGASMVSTKLPGSVSTVPLSLVLAKMPTSFAIDMVADGGVTDNTAALQRAIDYLWDKFGGGKVEVPAGDFGIQDVEFYPGIYIVGQGMGATRFVLPSSRNPTKPMFRANTKGKSPFYFGGIGDASLIGNGEGKQVGGFPPGNGNGTLINGIDFSALDAEPSGYRLYGWQAHNLQVEQFNDGIYLSNNLYSVLLSNILFRWCARGMFFYEQHPCMINCEFRMCDIGLECRAVIDWNVTQCTFSTSRIGIKGDISRSQIVNCRFWQNQEYAIELGSQNILMGCLIKGAQGNLPPPLPGMVLVKLRGRHNRIIGNTFYGDNLGPCIEFMQTNVALQAGNIVALNNAYINKGPFIEKTGDGSCPHVQVLGNYLLIQANAELDTTKGLFVEIPAGAQRWVGAKYADNVIRVEGNGTVNLPVPLLNCYDTSSSVSIHDNDVHLTGTITAQGFAKFASCQNSSIHDNRLTRATNNASFTAPIDLPAFPGTAGLICHSNVGFVTENAGSVQIGASDTSVTVTHGCDVTPNLQDIDIRMSGWGNANKCWVTNITATSFQINFDTNTGATFTAGWRVNNRYAGQQ